MRKHVIAGVIASSALLFATVPSAFAWQGPVTAGKPALNHNSPTGYYLWVDDGDFHLRTHGPNADHNFDATLHTGGTFENVDPIKLEADQGDHVDILDGGHELVIHFHTYDLTDGVDFTIRGGERLRLDLRLDRQLAPTDEIFLGSDGAHPATNPFTIQR